MHTQAYITRNQNKCLKLYDLHMLCIKHVYLLKIKTIKIKVHNTKKVTEYKSALRVSLLPNVSYIQMLSKLHHSAE